MRRLIQPLLLRRACQKLKLFMGKEVEITVNVNGIEVVGTRNVEEAPIKKGEEVNVFIHRAFTYGADGGANIVENANKFEDWIVI